MENKRDFLIVVDMQNDFIDGVLGTKEARLIVPYVTSKVTNFQGEVLFTKDTHDEDYLQTQEGKMIPSPHCVKNTWGWEIHRDLQNIINNRNYAVFEKNGFGSSQLLSYLQEHANYIKSLCLLGLCTDICVITNALMLKTFFTEIPIFVDEKGCAGVSVASHENALKAMAMCQIKII